MGRCKNCGVEIGPQETCVFATYKTVVGGREIVVCCPSCASDLEKAAPQPVEPAPAARKPARKPARKAKKAARKPAARRARKAPRKARKAPRRKVPRRGRAGRRRK